MSSMLDLLGSQLSSGDTLKQISGALGTDEKRAGGAIAAALPALLGQLSRNASKPEGAQALHRAIEKDHDGSLLDSLGGLGGLGGLLGQKPSRATNGDGIVGHVFGERRQRVETGLSKSTGLDTGSVSKLLVMLAPMVMGALGKAQRQKKMDTNGLTDFLNTERREVERKAPAEMGVLGKLLDADNDGDVDFDDIAKKGLGALGGLFGGR